MQQILSPCTVRILDDDTMEVIFEEPQRAITPGQSVAFIMALNY